MFMRRRRPLARAAMVGGAAYYAGKHTQRGQDANADRDARLDELEYQQQQQQAAPPAPAAPAKADPDEVMAQLQKLGQLKDQGILTDAEFEVQKQKLLQSM
jgi:Short C-terminal domain